MRISAAFPSDYLKAADLQGKQVKVVMSHVEMKDIGGDPKPVLHFEGKDRGMVLNKTNSNTIASAYGDDTDDWSGGELVLFEAMVDFQGKTVAAIRCKVPPRKPSQIVTSGPREVSPERAPPIMDDDIPF